MKVSKFGFEAQLLRWTESSNGGATIVLQLQDADDLAIFKSMTLAKKGIVGQRLAVAIAEIGDDEKLVTHELKNPAGVADLGQAPIVVTVNPYIEQARELAESARAPSAEKKSASYSAAHFPGGFCGLAVKWCDDLQFREWLAMEFVGQWEESASMVRLINKTADVERAAVVIKLVCGVTTRKALDTDASAHEIFELAIRKPYMAYLQEGA